MIKKFFTFLICVGLLFLFVMFGFVFYIFDSNTDYCLEDGDCPAGRQVNVNGKQIIVNEKTCKENSGKWYPKSNFCHF